MVDQSVDETIWRDLKEQIWFKLHGAERLQQPCRSLERLVQK